jgi:hypothetical protein
VCLFNRHSSKKVGFPLLTHFLFYSLSLFLLLFLAFSLLFLLSVLFFITVTFVCHCFLRRWCIEVLALLSLYIWLIPPDIYACLKD